MGTFIIRPTFANVGRVIFTGGTPPQDFSGWYSPTSSSLITAMLTNTFLTAYASNDTGAVEVGFTNTIRCSSAGACIYLDGALTPVAFNDLPPGFTVISAVVRARANLGASGQPDASYNGEFYLQRVNAVDGPIYTNPYTVSPVPSMLDLVNDGFGLKVKIIACPNLGDHSEVVNINELRVEGVYAASSFTWTLVNNSPVQAGSTITVISDPDEDPLLLDELDDITIDFLDENSVQRSIIIPSFITATPNFLSFILTLGGYFPQIITITAVGNGTQFSGSVALGKLSTIYFLNAPGIYRIITNKTSDTLYDVNDPGTTVEVKIPEPHAKLGFVP